MPEFELRPTQSLHIGNVYRVEWQKEDRWTSYFTSELMELGTTGEMWDGEPVVDLALFANNKVIDLTHPDLRLIEAE